MSEYERKCFEEITILRNLEYSFYILENSSIVQINQLCLRDNLGYTVSSKRPGYKQIRSNETFKVNAKKPFLNLGENKMVYSMFLFNSLRNNMLSEVFLVHGNRRISFKDIIEIYRKSSTARALTKITDAHINSNAFQNMSCTDFQSHSGSSHKDVFSQYTTKFNNVRKYFFIFRRHEPFVRCFKQRDTVLL